MVQFSLHSRSHNSLALLYHSLSRLIIVMQNGVVDWHQSEAFLLKIVSIIVAILIAGFIWLAWPLYSFFAHQGEAPFPPWGWMEITEPAPSNQTLSDTSFATAGANTLNAMIAHRETIGAPAMTAAVAVKGNVVWQGAVGWADIADQTPATVETQLRVGSTSKAITASALARLVDKGVIDLDAPISAYMAELPNDGWANITPRMLASHMSGVPHYGDNQDGVGRYKTGALVDHYADVRDALEIFDDSPLLFEPGADFEYSSLGTVLLGAVMSEAAGKSYRDLIADEVLAHAGATSTIVAPMRAKDNKTLATFYFHEDGRYREWRPIDLSHRLPGGGWASTSTDLVKIGSLWLDDGYVTEETRAAFWTPQRLTNGEVNEQDYAIGWRWREWDIDGLGVARNANHGGVSRGAQSWLLVLPDYDMAVAFNINSKTDQFRDFGIFYETIIREFALAIEAARIEEEAALDTE